MKDLLIPIVFPDYKILIETPSATIKVPDYLPYVDIFPSEVRVPHTSSKLSDLGHAGVLFINGKTGLTKYYEYGRYDSKKQGWVKKMRNLPDLNKSSDGSFTRSALINVLHTIAAKAGKGGRISAAYIEVEGKFQSMLAYAQKRMALNSKPSRESYQTLSYNCGHFMKGVMDAAEVDSPWMIDPRPNSYIEEIQDDYPKLEYWPSSNKLSIQGSNTAFGGPS